MSASVAIEELYETLDPRTLEILERRRGGAGVHRRGWLVRRALLAADLLGLSLAFAAAQAFYRWRVGASAGISDLTEFSIFAASLPVWVVVFKLYGLYDKDEERTDHSTVDDFARVTHLVTLFTFLLYTSSHLTSVFNPQLSKVCSFWLLAIFGTTSLRALARGYCRRQVNYLQNTVIVGAGDVGQSLARKVLQHPGYGLNLVGFIDAHPKERIAGLEHLTVLGDPTDLPELVGLLDVERVIFAFSNDVHEVSLELVRKLNELDVQVDIVPRFFEVLSPGVDLHALEGVLMCGLRPTKLSRSSRLIKRTTDLIGSVVGLVVLAPLVLVTAIAIFVDSPGPVFFRQIRIGSGDRPFRIWKFRTMDADAEESKDDVAHLNKHLLPGGDPRMFKIDNDPRVTRVGRFLRRTSIDELPQLINVFLGEMSLVGPRPLIPEEAQYVDSWGTRRVDLKPGITGLWQVLGRDDIAFEEMVKLDYVYVTSWSLGGDLRLLLRTIPIVARGS